MGFSVKGLRRAIVNKFPPRNVILYGAIGVISAGTDAGVFALLTYVVGLASLRANLVSVPVGIMLSFILNRRFNFKVMDHPARRAIIFFGVGFTGLLFSQGIIYAGTTMGFSAWGVKLVSILLVAAFQFTMNSLISFGIRMGNEAD